MLAVLMDIPAIMLRLILILHMLLISTMCYFFIFSHKHRKAFAVIDAQFNVINFEWNDFDMYTQVIAKKV